MDMKRRDALARDINLEDITSSRRNADVLWRLRDNIVWEDINELYIEEEEEEDDDFEDNKFIIREGDDLSWLGYFIGRNYSLDYLSFVLPHDRERIGAFIEGVSYNRSLSGFSFQGFDTDVGLQNLCSFFRENDNLKMINLSSCEIGRECARDLALALRQREVNSLTSLVFSNNNLGDEGFADIVQAIWTQPELDYLECSYNNIGRISCEALGALLRERNSKLTSLYLSNNAIDDEGIHALVPDLCNSNNLQELSISDPITAMGLRSLSPFLQSDGCRLRYLSGRLRLSNEEAAALADALKGNKSITTLNLRGSQRNMTYTDWSAFSKLLCDTSSINNTYLSNHTLTNIYVDAYNDMDDPWFDVCYIIRSFVTKLLEMNAAAQKKDTMRDISPWRNQQISMQSLTRCKIFMSHPDLDMEPLFNFKLKLLPWVIEWFRKSIRLCSEEVGVWKEWPHALRCRELSAVYKFVHSMPMLISDGYWTNVLNGIQPKRQKFQEQRLEAEKRKLPLMLQKAQKGFKKAEKIERSALKRLRR